MRDRTISGELPRSPAGKLVRAGKDALRVGIARFAPGLIRKLTNFHRLDDRVVLETVILPFFRDQADIRSILWVGSDWYTKPYEQFFAGRDYWTLEIDPSKKRFGSDRHIVAPLSGLKAFAREGTFDLILCNGVFYPGGIDSRDEAEASLMACFRTLKPGGWLMLGLDEAREFRPPVPPAETEALSLFRPAIFPPTGTSRQGTQTEYRHVYEFYQRPA